MGQTGAVEYTGHEVLELPQKDGKIKADDLYFRISRHAIEMAEQMKEIFRDAGLRFYLESPTNQQFVILENGQMERLAENVAFSFWEKYDEDHTVVRFATSRSTAESDMEALKALL